MPTQRMYRHMSRVQRKTKCSYCGMTAGCPGPPRRFPQRCALRHALVRVCAAALGCRRQYFVRAGGQRRTRFLLEALLQLLQHTDLCKLCGERTQKTPEGLGTRCGT